MRRTVRWLSALLCLVMIVGLLPVGVIAVSSNSTDKFGTAQLDIANEKYSTLAPGINQDAYTLYNNKGEQVKMFVTTADMSVDTVKLFASYKDMDPTNYGMSKLTEQVDAFNKKAAAGDEYYQGTVVAGINASYYNMINGKPTGTFVMNGIDVTTESEGNSYGYFAVMKDGSVKIGNKGDYSKDKGNIQEAIGIHTMLIVDGEICSGLDTTKYYPRQTIGITADGDVILMTADGNQAPKSIGLTVQEQAQVMLDLGCVWAGHLDGGGSCTYAAKAEGSDEFAIVNSPSDGSERSVSNGFLIVSTAAPSYTFDHVVYDVENDYLAPGASVKVSMSGVSSTGNAAEIPDGITYVAENGTIANGVFTAGNTMGNATITAMYEGKAVGQTVLNVVTPDAITFANTTMTVPYDKTVNLKLEATYGAKAVTITPSNIQFQFSDDSIGTIDGFSFTAGSEGVATSATLTATLVLDPAVTTTATVKLGKGSEVVYDFENGTNQNIIFDETPGTQYNYVWPETQQQVVTAANGKVHSGKYALGMHVDYSNSLESGYMKTSIYATETKTFKNAVGVGCWLYIPDECVGLWVRWTLRSVTGYNSDGTPIFNKSTINSNTMDTTAGGTGVVYTFCEPGWHYLYADTSAYAEVGWAANSAMMQFYISDRDGSAYNYVASQNSNIPSSFQFYLDDVTVDYSSAVDDREAPVISNVTYAVEGMPDAAALNGQTVTSNKVTFGASVAEYTGKDNYTGVDPATVKAYIDGVEVAATYTNGLVSVTDVILTNGKHTIKFSACDYMGNYSSVIKTIVVNAAASDSTVKLVPADPSADRILLGSIYNMDLVATAIEEVDGITVALDLDNNSTWQLDHMIVADGFSADYTVDETDNIATITITRTGSNATTGEAVLATLPVRVWTLKTGYVYENGTKAGQQAMTLSQFRAGKEFWRMSVITNVDMGVLTRVDGTSATFTGERVFCDTEMWGNFAAMDATAEGKAYYNAWDGGHIHSAEPVADKAPTCTTAGYTGRTYCAVCDSVVDWGTTVPTTGHSYAVTDGVLQCDCGEKFNGVHTDGNTYVDGVVIADGWSGESYYVGGEKLTGLQEIDGVYYDFGTEGVCPNKARVDGFFYDESISAYRYFTAGLLTTGEVSIYPEVYFYDENGVAVSGEVDVLGYTCYFDEKGAFVSSDDASVVDAGFSGTNIQYVLLSSGLLKVDGEGVMKDYTANGQYPAWIIQNDEKAITALEIGNGITEIGRFGFYNIKYLKTIAFEENSSLKTIGWAAFGHNWRLTGVTIPASVEKLDNCSFYNCGAMTYVAFEENSQLKTIGSCAFQKGLWLETVYIPDSVTSIATDAFASANEDLVLQVAENSVGHVYAVNNGMNYELREGKVIEVKSGALSDTISWTLYSDGTLNVTGTGTMPNFASHSEQPWYTTNHLIKKIVIDKDITSLGNYAFCYAQNVAEIVFEEGSKLEKVGILSFFNVPSVTSVVLPETVTYIGAYGFGDCFALESLYIPQSTSYIYKTAFNGSTKVVLNVAAGTYAEDFAKQHGIAYETREFVYEPIASGDCGENVQWAMYENGELWITGSGAMVNYGSHNDQPWYTTNHKIKKIVIGKDITSLGNYAFCYAQNVTEIVFEEGSKLEKVGILSFFNLPSVTSVVLPETVTYIGAYGFGDCFGLESLYIPQSVSYIYKTAFSGSSKLVLNVAAGTYAEDFAKQYGIAYEPREFVYEPIASGECGENAQWAMYENGELWITGSGAMVNYSSHNDQPWYTTNHKIKRIVIGKDITAIGNYAFCYAQNVTEIVFEEGSQLQSVGVLSFMNLPSVSNVVLPETVTSISAYAFGDCFGLNEIYIPAGVSFIYKNAFEGSTNVVLNVAAGSYAEQFAQGKGIAYTVR